MGDVAHADGRAHARPRRGGRGARAPRGGSGRTALRIGYDDIFDTVENAPEAVAHLGRALDAEGVAHDPASFLFRASEDFGRFGQKAPSAMVFLGAGEACQACTTPTTTSPTR